MLLGAGRVLGGMAELGLAIQHPTPPKALRSGCGALSLS